MGKLSKAFLFLFGFLAVVSVSFGIMMAVNKTPQEVATEMQLREDLPTLYREVGEYSTNPEGLKAMVKGSIYETGEEMTVYGACFRGDGTLLPAATATFSSWYSNGTQWQSDAAMTSINNSGRWLIHVNMSPVSGTYLTQIKCSLGGQTAIAFGEWQNPNWVARIATINDYVVLINSTTVSIENKVDALSAQLNANVTTILLEISNLSMNLTNYYNDITNQISNFSADVQANFSTVINKLNELNASVGGLSPQMETEHEAIYNLVHSLDYSQWVLDSVDYFYTGIPNTYDFTAVDMSAPENVWAVTDGGHIAVFNGTNYTLTTYAGYDWWGVSALEANTPYGWVVGTNGTACYYSINGASPVHLSATSATACEDIALFYSPTALNAYVLADNGDILFYNGTWTVMNNTGEAGDGRISVLPGNDYFYFAQNDTLTVYDESTWTRYTVAGVDFNDVEAIYSDEVYLVTAGAPFKVYLYDGDSVDLQYTATGSVATAEAISAHNEFDIWVVTDTPGSYYHFDGRQWSFAEYPYSSFIGIVIGFNASASLDMKDIDMFNEKVGYSVGDNGLIMKFYNHYDERFDDVDSYLSTLITNLAAVDAKVVNVSNMVWNASNMIANLTNIVFNMNASMMAEFSNLNSRLTEINSTMITRFDYVDTVLFQINTTVDYVLTNVTYIRLYLENTVYPTVNNTYTFMTTTLWNKILGIEQTVNQTRDLAIEINDTTHDTNIIVTEINETTSNIDNTTLEILNRTPNIRAWITV